MSTSSGRWKVYYDAIEGRDPRPIILKALAYFKHPGKAIDLGCGPGNESIALLKRGWQVLAIDNDQDALDRLEKRLDDTSDISLEKSAFEDVELVPADLIHSSYALPFCHPTKWDEMWGKIIRNLKPGGVFAGQLFGINDAWNIEKHIKFHSREEVNELMGSFDILYFDENEGTRKTATGGSKYWHTFELILQKR